MLEFSGTENVSSQLLPQCNFVGVVVVKERMTAAKQSQGLICFSVGPGSLD